MADIRESKSDVWIGAGLLAFCGFASWRTLLIKKGFSSSVAGPSFVPWIMIGGIALLAVLMMVRGMRRASAGQGALIQMPEKRTMLSILAFVALLVAYSGAFYSVGYIPSTLATFIIGLWLMGERKIWLLIAFPVGMTFAVYFAFTQFLSVWLP